MDTDGNGTPHDVKNAAKEIFCNCEIKYVDIQRRPLSKIVTRLPSCRRQKGKEIFDLSRKIEENLHVFENRLNVTAVCASYKVTEAVEKDIPCVTVFVLGKGKIPAKETNIQKIKEDNGHLFDYAEFDIVEGYYRPASYPFHLKEYASPLHGGVGIGVKGAPGAGTLGGFFVDENKECYILSNDHVLNPPKSIKYPLLNNSGKISGGLKEDANSTVRGARIYCGFGEDENNTSDVEIEDRTDQIIEQPAQVDYGDVYDAAKARLENIVSDPVISNILQANSGDLSGNDVEFDQYLRRLKKKLSDAQRELQETENDKPRRIGEYLDGLKSNVDISCNNKSFKFYVDVAIAKVDKKELNFITWGKPKNETNRSPVYGFDMLKDVIPTGEIVDPDTFIEEIRAQDPDTESKEELTFLKIGRTTGLTDDGRIDTSFQKLFVNRVSFPKQHPCAPAMAHTPFQYCTSCKPSKIRKEKLVKHESDEQQLCSTCNKKLKNKVFSFWEHNCLVIRKRGKPFAETGDSGSLIFDNHGRAWGLLHGIFTRNDVFFSLVSPLSVALKGLEKKCGKKLKLW